MPLGGLLIITGGFVFGCTRGLVVLRGKVLSIGDAVLSIYVRLSDVLTFESINNLDLFVLLV